LPDESVIAFYSAVGKDKASIKHTVKSYKARFADEEFYKEFARCLREYAAANPSYAGKNAFVTVLLPDGLINTATFNIPGVNKKNTENLFNVAYEGTYKNSKELKMNHYAVAQNKQFSTIAIAVIRQKLVQEIYTACTGSNMFASILTFSANACVNGALSLVPKLKNENFILLDIKESRSTLAFVNKGLTLGCYDLPFGWELLNQSKPAAENMLFSHSVAELAVVNAKEKAKAKQLSTMEADTSQALEQDENAEGGLSQEAENPAARQISQIKTLPKKVPRALPKWMQREYENTPEAIAYENFRIFVKWALEFRRANRRLCEIAEPTKVYINMPEQFEYLLDKVSEEEEQNKIKFVSLDINKEKDVIREHIELYGGLFAGQLNSLNNF